MDLEEIRRQLKPAVLLQHMRRNAGLRLISVLLAIGLWVFVNAGQHGSTTSMEVPISYRDLPVGFVIVNPHPDFVKIEVAGPRTLLSLIDPGRLTVRLDLTGVGVGQASFKLGPDTFNVPRQTNVTSISPSQIVLDIDKMMGREVPVHLNLSGKVAKGYKVVSISLVPPTASIRGPSRLVSRLDNIDTEPCSINGATAEVNCEVGLVAPSAKLRIYTDTVNAKVEVAPLIADREFHAIAVQVRDSDYKFRIEPRHINLTVRGPAPALAKLDLKGSVYVEANGIAPGSHDVPVQVDLPDGVELVRQSPAKIKLRMYREKQAESG